MSDLRTLLRAILTGRRRGLRRRVLRRWWHWMTTRSPESGERAEAEPPPTPASEGHRLEGAAALADGEVGEWMVDGRPVAVVRAGERFFALHGECPHAGGPLGEGSLVDGQLLCPLHGWSFDMETGACDMDPDLEVACFTVAVSGDDLVLEV